MRHRFTHIALAAALGLLLACTSNTGTTSSPTGGTQGQHLFVADDSTGGQIRVYALPLTSSSTPQFTLPHDHGMSVAVSATGDLASLNLSGQVKIFPGPLSAASTAAATFMSPGGVEQLAVGPSGKLLACTQGPKVNVFTPPFTNATVFSAQIADPNVTATMGAALDAQGNLYLAGSGNHVSVLPNEGGAAATVNLAAPTGSSLRQVALSGSQLFLANVAGATGSVYVYNLPITAASTPAATITTGANSPEAVAVDAAGNLYVGNLGDGTILVYAPPFSSASAPTITLSTTAVIFGIAIGK